MTIIEAKEVTKEYAHNSLVSTQLAFRAGGCNLRRAGPWLQDPYPMGLGNLDNELRTYSGTSTPTAICLESDETGKYGIEDFEDGRDILF